MRHLRLVLGFALIGALALPAVADIPPRPRPKPIVEPALEFSLDALDPSVVDDSVGWSAGPKAVHVAAIRYWQLATSQFFTVAIWKVTAKGAKIVKTIGTIQEDGAGAGDSTTSEKKRASFAKALAKQVKRLKLDPARIKTYSAGMVLGQEAPGKGVHLELDGLKVTTQLYAVKAADETVATLKSPAEMKGCKPGGHSATIRKVATGPAGSKFAMLLVDHRCDDFDEDVIEREGLVDHVIEPLFIPVP